MTLGSGGGNAGDLASDPPLSQRLQSLPGVSGHRTHGPGTWPLCPSSRPSHNWHPNGVEFVSFGPGKHLGPSPAGGIGSIAHMLPGGVVPSTTNVPGMDFRVPSG